MGEREIEKGREIERERKYLKRSPYLKIDFIYKFVSILFLSSSSFYSMYLYENLKKW